MYSFIEMNFWQFGHTLLYMWVNVRSHRLIFFPFFCGYLRVRWAQETEKKLFVIVSFIHSFWVHSTWSKKKKKISASLFFTSSFGYWLGLVDWNPIDLDFFFDFWMNKRMNDCVCVWMNWIEWINKWMDEWCKSYCHQYTNYSQL